MNSRHLIKYIYTPTNLRKVYKITRYLHISYAISLIYSGQYSPYHVEDNTREFIQE